MKGLVIETTLGDCSGTTAEINSCNPLLCTIYPYHGQIHTHVYIYICIHICCVCMYIYTQVLCFVEGGVSRMTLGAEAQLKHNHEARNRAD